MAFNRYFEDELSYLREMGREFAQAYPALAPMLADRGGDPDVERLMEGVAFLTGRIRQKLDDEYPQLAQSIAALAYPQLISPLPGTAILEVSPLPNVLRGAKTIPAGCEFASVKVNGTSCRFSAATSCEIHPWQLERVSLESLRGGLSQLRLELASDGGAPIETFLPNRLRFHVCDELRHSLQLLAWLGHHVASVQVYAPDSPDLLLELTKDSISLCGFGDDEALLPLPETAFNGFRLLQEYFVLPGKFAFFEVDGLRRILALDATIRRLGILIRFDTPLSLREVTSEHVKIHCVPVVNVFETTSEPVRVSAEREEYAVRPAGLPPGSGEVFQLKKVEAAGRTLRGPMEVLPFFEFAHVRTVHDEARVYYTTARVPSVVGEGSDLRLTLGSAEGSVGVPGIERLSIDMLATNGPLANAVRAGEICVPTASSPPFARFRNLHAVTPYVPVPIGQELQWRVLAHCAMNLSSLTHAPTLRGALAVYDFHAIGDRQAARASQLRMDAVREVRVSPMEKLFRGAPIRGVAIEVELDERGFTGDGDIHLFGAILERLFSNYISINSFSQTTVRATQTRLEFSWPARNGNTNLI